MNTNGHFAAGDRVRVIPAPPAAVDWEKYPTWCEPMGQTCGREYTVERCGLDYVRLVDNIYVYAPEWLLPPAAYSRDDWQKRLDDAVRAEAGGGAVTPAGACS